MAQKRKTARAQRPKSPRTSPYTFAMMAPRMSGAGTVMAVDEDDARRKVRSAFPDALAIAVKRT